MVMLRLDLLYQKDRFWNILLLRTQKRGVDMVAMPFPLCRSLYSVLRGRSLLEFPEDGE